MTAVPGVPRRRRAIWLAIVPDGTNTAASAADPGGEGGLEGVDGGVLAGAVVADLGLGHGLAHGRRGPGDGVGAEVDEGLSGPSPVTVPVG